MTVARKFDFNKSYEEIEISGENYRIEFNDEKMTQYTKSFDKFYTETKAINEIDTSELTPNEQIDTFKKMQEITKGIVEELLGEGSYSRLYEASGKSLMNIIEMVEYLSDIVGEKSEKLRADKKKKYLVNKKQK